MATSSNAGNFGAVAPAAIDPFPIESVLAKIVGENNIGNAQNLLSQYHQQQVASEGNYNYNLQQQHDFARQQLAAQMHENNVKALQEGYKTPGLLGAYNSPQYSDIIAGIDPTQMQDASTNLRTMQLADQAQKGGAAAASFTAAGAQPQQSGMDVLSGGTAGPVGLPEQERVAAINANARLAAARIRAAGQNPPGPSTHIKVDSPHGPIDLTYSGKVPQSQVTTDLDARGVPRINTGSTAPAPLPDEANRTPPPGGTGTNVQRAPAATSTMTPKPGNAEPGKADFQTKMAANIEAYKDRPWYADVKAGMATNKGMALAQPDGKGGWRPQGASGKVYY